MPAPSQMSQITLKLDDRDTGRVVRALLFMSNGLQRMARKAPPATAEGLRAEADAHDRLAAIIAAIKP